MPGSNIPDVVKWLKVSLSRSGRTQKELGDHLGLAPNRIAEILSGKRHLKATEMLQTAEFLHSPLLKVRRIESGEAEERPGELTDRETVETARRTLGGLIRRRRSELNMSMADLGKLVGVTRQTVAAWEAGRTSPRGARRRSVSAALELEPTVFDLGQAVGRVPEGSQGPPQERRGSVAWLLEELSTERLEQLAKIAVKILAERANKARTVLIYLLGIVTSNF